MLDDNAIASQLSNIMRLVKQNTVGLKTLSDSVAKMAVVLIAMSQSHNSTLDIRRSRPSSDGTEEHAWPDDIIKQVIAWLRERRGNIRVSDTYITPYSTNIHLTIHTHT